MKPYSLSHFVIPDGWEHEGCIYVEPLDWWKRCYKIESMYRSFLVNADDESEAMDSLIDWLSDTLPTHLFNDDEIKEMDQAELDEFYCGGNDGRYLNELTYRITEVPFPYVLVSIIQMEHHDGYSTDEERIHLQKVEMQSLEDFHEFNFEFFDGKMMCVKSNTTSNDGFPPFNQYFGYFYHPDGKPITDKSFYDWLLAVVL